MAIPSSLLVLLQDCLSLGPVVSQLFILHLKGDGRDGGLSGDALHALGFCPASAHVLHAEYTGCAFSLFSGNHQSEFYNLEACFEGEQQAPGRLTLHSGFGFIPIPDGTMGTSLLLSYLCPLQRKAEENCNHH